MKICKTIPVYFRSFIIIVSLVCLAAKTGIASAGSATIKSKKTGIPASPNQRKDSVEITEIDFVQAGKFNGNHATVFGIGLGSGKSLVKEKTSGYSFLSLRQDAFNPRRSYLVDSTGTNIAYLIWTNYDSGLYQIVLYPAMAKYMKGLSAAILSPACLDKASEVYKSFLGEPSASKVTLDNPKIEMKTTLFYYPKWNIVIEESKSSSGLQYNMLLTHKW
jgi:hypothetical protein